MHSYIDIHHFTPRPDYRTLDELTALIDEAMLKQNAQSLLTEEEIHLFKTKIVRCMDIYYQLVGIDEEVINGRGTVEPCGILPRFTKSLIRYFQELEGLIPTNKEIITLQYSGLTTIKIRYKNTDSVIKKIVKLGLRNPENIEDPLKIFLKEGALHDLVGLLFVCSYPYEKEWLARALYNFFEYNHRTDDHLIYGFYTVKKKSGYQGLHCDNTLFNPRFDTDFSDESTSISLDPNSIFGLINPEDSENEILHKLKNYFNIEIQIHTTFENLWATMEHTKSYNIQAKGAGRNSEITVQWKLLSDAMHNLEHQFEQLQIDTEQAQFKSARHKGYTFINTIIDRLDTNLHDIYTLSNNKVYSLEALLNSHEISRQDYVLQLQREAESIDNFSQEQSDLTIRSIFLLHSAYIYYGLTNYREYFNSEDIQQFVKIGQNYYRKIHHFLNTHPDIYKSDLINIIAVIRYLYLEHKHGLGLMQPPNSSLYSDKLLSSHQEKLTFFTKGISLITRLSDEDLDYMKQDYTSYLKIIYTFDTIAREWELFPAHDKQSLEIRESIDRFRTRFINSSLHRRFHTLLETDKISNVGFVVKFYTTLIWHGILSPLDGMRQIIKYSAYDKIVTSDLFYYELAAYRFLMMCCCGEIDGFCHENSIQESDPARIKHLQSYHRENMIQQLFRIKRNESTPEFDKAKLNFEQITGTRFQIDHFSGNIPKGEIA
ncbi:MAG: hypothetical protein U9R27_01245 [Campylobacterota bacterium]|nr:hypothetical protein [Campylobacterota bacterium]